MRYVSSVRDETGPERSRVRLAAGRCGTADSFCPYLLRFGKDALARRRLCSWSDHPRRHNLADLGQAASIAGRIAPHGSRRGEPGDHGGGEIPWIRYNEPPIEPVDTHCSEQEPWNWKR